MLDLRDKDSEARGGRDGERWSAQICGESADLSVNKLFKKKGSLMSEERIFTYSNKPETIRYHFITGPFLPSLHSYI